MTSEEKPTNESSTIDQRRCQLLTDPNYAIILSFLEKFRSTLDLPVYSFQRFEDHLLQSHERSETNVVQCGLNESSHPIDSSLQFHHV